MQGPPPCYDRGGGVWKGLMGGCPPPPQFREGIPLCKGGVIRGTPTVQGGVSPVAKGLMGGIPQLGGRDLPPPSAKCPAPPPPPIAKAGYGGIPWCGKGSPGYGRG